MVSTYNDIDPELYMMLMASRKTAFDIAQNRDFDIVMRYCLVLEYAKDIQDMKDKGTLSKIMNIQKYYSSEEYLRERTKTFNILHNEEYTRYSYIYEYLKIFDDFEIINKSWTDMVNHEKEYMYEQSSNEEYKSRYNRFEQYYHEKEYEYEQLLVYFIFRYYLKAVNDDDVFSKVKMAVVSFLIIKDLDVLRFCDNEGSLSFEEQVDIMHIYSREIEHSYENFEKLSLMLSEDERFSYHVLISLLVDGLQNKNVYSQIALIFYNIVFNIQSKVLSIICD